MPPKKSDFLAKNYGAKPLVPPGAWNYAVLNNRDPIQVSQLIPGAKPSIPTEYPSPTESPGPPFEGPS